MTNNKAAEEKKQIPAETNMPGPIIIAPRIESMDVTIVMGDKKSAYMNFNGGEVCVEDPYDDGLGDDELDAVDEIEKDLPDKDGVPKVMDEIDRSACEGCEYTDCSEHPQSREAQKPRDIKARANTSQLKGAELQHTSQNSKFTVSEGEAALDGLPEHFKAFIKILRAAGLDVKVKNYEQKEDQSDE